MKIPTMNSMPPLFHLNHKHRPSLWQHACSHLETKNETLNRQHLLFFKQRHTKASIHNLPWYFSKSNSHCASTKTSGSDPAPEAVKDGITRVWGRSSDAGRKREGEREIEREGEGGGEGDKERERKREREQQEQSVCCKTGRRHPSCVHVAGFVCWPW